MKTKSDRFFLSISKAISLLDAFLTLYSDLKQEKMESKIFFSFDMTRMDFIQIFQKKEIRKRWGHSWLTDQFYRATNFEQPVIKTIEAVNTTRGYDCG